MNELKEKILNLCNDSGLPLEAIIYVVKDVWRDAEDTLRAYNTQKQTESKEEENK
jgi:hypothetical protein